MGREDERVLFPDIKVEGHTFRPWTLGQAVALAPTLGAIVDDIGKSGVKDALSTILDAIDIEEQGMDSILKAFTASWRDVLKALPALIPDLLPHAPKILSVSLKVSEEEVCEFNLVKTSRLLAEIVTQNYAYLKNYYGPDTKDLSKAS